MQGFIFTGEKSGEAHGFLLVQALLKEMPTLKITGVFGSQITSLGFTPIIPMEAFQMIGFTAVIKALPRIYKNFKKVLRFILESSPNFVVLIDYPGFNLRLAKALRKKNYRGKIIHYICPSVWAWKKERINEMAKTLDLLLCIFPFEAELFTNTPLKALYVGNPTLEATENYYFKNDWKKELKIDPNHPILAIFPGSRQQEIEHNLPIQLAAAELLKKEFPSLEICVSNACSKYHNIPSRYTYELMKEAYVAISKCGTVCLELALFQTPTVVTYQISKWNYLIAKYLFKLDKLPFFSLPNILLKKSLFKELIYTYFTKESTYKEAKALFNLQEQARCKMMCQELKDQLQTTLPPSTLAAKAIFNLLNPS